MLVILAGIAVATTHQAWPAFSAEGLSFITSSDWNPSENKFGALAFIYGTLLSSAIALLIGVPISLGIALYTNEMAHRRVKGPVTYVIDLLAAIPSVVYGLWGVLVLAPNILPDLRQDQRCGRRLAGPRLALRRPDERPQLHDRRPDPRHHDHPDRHLALP